MNIHDIAKELGVSTATVSRAINNSGYVKLETREKIEALIKKNNYVPSAVARSLSKQDSSCIGIIVPDIENPFFAGVIHGINIVAEKHNFHILFFSSNETSALEHRALKTVREQRIKGVIITPVDCEDKQTKKCLQELVNGGSPVVLVDRELRGGSFHGVFIDNVRGAFEAVEAFIKNGHRDIAIIAGPENSMPGDGRLDGYLKALQQYGIPVRQEYIARSNFMAEQGYICMRSLLDLPNPPTAVFASNNLTTIGCLKCLYERKKTLGKDISLIGFDDIDVIEYVGFKLSVVDRAVSEMGVSAMNILLQQLEGDVSVGAVQRVVFTPKLVLRGSEKISKLE